MQQEKCIFADQSRGQQRIFHLKTDHFFPKSEAVGRGLRTEMISLKVENPLLTKGLVCKDIPISLLNRKIREIMRKYTI